MDINEFLAEAHKALDAATLENKNGELAQCMYQLGRLHGLLLKFIREQPNKSNIERISS